jgi:hypothetical protein
MQDQSDKQTYYKREVVARLYSKRKLISFEH